MNKLRVIFMLSIIGLLGACAHSGDSGASEDDQAMRMEKYTECQKEYPPEKVTEMCGKYLKTN